MRKPFLNAASIVTLLLLSTTAVHSAYPVLAIYTQDWGLIPKEPGLKLIVAVWGDGNIVWSDDRLHGGSAWSGTTCAPGSPN